MRKPLLFLTLSICFIAFLSAQNILPIGSWQTHFPYHAGEYVTQSSDEVYYSTGYSVIVFDKEDPDNPPRFITKTDKLSQTGIQLIKYLDAQESLIVVYDDGTMDILAPEGTLTMPQIKNFPNIIIGKKINDIHIQNDSTILLAGSFGISKVRISETTKEFSFTTFTGVNVNAVTEYQGQIYMGTNEGVYRIASDNFFPEIFSSWEYLDASVGFPDDYSTYALEVYKNKLYIGADSTLFQFDNNNLTQIHTESFDLRLTYLSGEGESLLIGYQCRQPTDDFPCSKGKLLYTDETAIIQSFPSFCAGVPKNAIEDEKGRIWFGDEWRGFRRVSSLSNTSCKVLKINSPWSQKAWNIEIVDNEVWVASGSYTPTYTGLFTRDGFYSFIDGQWTTYNDNSQSVMKGRDPNERGDDLFAIIDVEINTKTRKKYAASYFEGLIEIDEEGELHLYDELNSTLRKAKGDTTRVRVASLATDEDGILWISNPVALNDKPISALKPDGTWLSFGETCGLDVLLDVVIDPNGFKWFVNGNEEAGILLFDEGDIDDINDDKCQFFSAANSNLQNNEVVCLAVDLDGDVWAGTTDGIIIFECGSNAFDEECNGSRRIVVGADGNPEYLFKDERIETIAIDAANRKWIGTGNGAYLLSANGEEQIHYFTSQNSPLPDNVVLDINCNLETGEVWFATNQGMVSFQSDAIKGEVIHKTDITVYPNPVHPDYQGPIAIKGFSRDATVKITDISGSLVYETKALGGQVIWDGNDYNGRRVNTGVYLVFATTNSRFNFNDPSSAVAKVVLIN